MARFFATLSRSVLAAAACVFAVLGALATWRFFVVAYFSNGPAKNAESEMPFLQTGLLAFIATGLFGFWSSWIARQPDNR